MSDDLLDLTGKVALVTGGSRGLGREMALGWDLEAFAATARRSIPLGRGGEAHEVVGAAFALA